MQDKDVPYFTSTHKLEFLSRTSFGGWNEYKIGTVKGQWRSVPGAYQILSFLNEEPGNGHLDDVFEWFDNSCKREGKNLEVLEVMNPRFRDHLINKRGFQKLGREHLIKLLKG